MQFVIAHILTPLPPDPVSQQLKAWVSPDPVLDWRDAMIILWFVLMVIGAVMAWRRGKATPHTAPNAIKKRLYAASAMACVVSAGVGMVIFRDNDAWVGFCLVVGCGLFVWCWYMTMRPIKRHIFDWDLRYILLVIAAIGVVVVIRMRWPV